MTVEYYKYHFSHLHTAKYKGIAAPHKAVLLLTVMDMIERGCVTSCDIVLSEELIATYKRVWAQKVPAHYPFTCDICKPFFHMQHEPFWRLVEHSEQIDQVAEELGLYGNSKKELPAQRYTVTALNANFRCARVDAELFQIIQVAEKRQKLEQLLINIYLSQGQTPNRNSLLLAMGLLALVA